MEEGIDEEITAKMLDNGVGGKKWKCFDKCPWKEIDEILNKWSVLLNSNEWTAWKHKLTAYIPGTKGYVSKWVLYVDNYKWVN